MRKYLSRFRHTFKGHPWPLCRDLDNPVKNPHAWCTTCELRLTVSESAEAFARRALDVHNSKQTRVVPDA